MTTDRQTTVPSVPTEDISTITGGTTQTSTSQRSNSTSRNENQSSYRPSNKDYMSRRDHNLEKVFAMHSDFKGANAELGAVVGLRDEMEYLKNEKLVAEFLDIVLIHVLQS